MIDFTKHFVACKAGEMKGNVSFTNVESLSGERHRALSEELSMLPLGDNLEANYAWEEVNLSAEFQNQQVMNARDSNLRSYIGSLNQAQQGMAPATSQEFHRVGGKARAINDLLASILDKLPLISYKDGLYYYKPPVWRLLDKHTIITCLKEAFGTLEIIDCLDTGDFKELYTLLLAEPQIQITEDDITVNLNHIVCRDGVYNYINNEILQHRADMYVFSYIDVSVYDIYEEARRYD